ncbi:MAG: hypothetical protein CVU16_13285 [Betaproteobacteria bacterium HGW-Betaproteobacteria-10]|nr:MAG: hypothetical protein CVU16_13285 [Betaproteobacteria bacterium HGW-Betaproteobacteria-10]
MRAAMATDTAVGNSCMAHACRREGIEIGVTGIAERRGRNVCSWLGNPLACVSIVAAIAAMVADCD